MRDVYQEITNTIIKQIEEAGTDWIKPFHSMGSVPVNYNTGNTYRGINILLLGMTGKSQIWSSYKQWQEKGGNVRKGEKGTQIVFFKMLEKENKQGEKSTFPLIRYSTLFSIDQVEGIELPKTNLPDLTQSIANADIYIKNTGANVFESDKGAFYMPSQDKIGMPPRNAFIDTPTSTATECYYATLLHELTHWTGCKKRLDRFCGGLFGSENYAFEELVAELGAAFQCGSLGIASEPRKDHSQYLKSWLKCLKENKNAIFKAASEAQKAVDYIEGLQQAEAKAA